MQEIVDRNINSKSEIHSPKVNVHNENSGLRTSLDYRKADEQLKSYGGSPQVHTLKSNKISMGKPAGKLSKDLMTELDRAMIAAKASLRPYNPSSEEDRKIHYSHLEIKDNDYYNKKDSLWNEPQRLEPKKFARYSEQNIDPETTFKKTVKDLP